MTAFAKDARILFQGDSITDGNRGRNQDPNHILGHGYAFVIAAKYGAAFPELNLTFLNRGVSGNTIPDLTKRWPKDTLELKPTLLSVLIGVNDTSRDLPLDQFEEGYDRLLADAKADNPKIRLVLGEPFTLPSGPKKDGWEKWQARVKQRQEIVAKLAKKTARPWCLTRRYSTTLAARPRRLLDLGRRPPHVFRASADGRRVGTDGPGVLAGAREMNCPPSKYPVRGKSTRPEPGTLIQSTHRQVFLPRG